ncbi:MULTISPECIES: 3-hydroxybutyrate dehydrogenase [Peribacillus]|uniref:3-hydroxybutyrate dehydrogenase n=1 Tax=Peribacillus TaxID=2675229 RepID=UPI0006FF803D|nr:MULTISPECIES: 3-hydroxybutyrate dehydrogenase [Peribacillus]KQU27034.1 3-hydroxybutyrate dehydrogenase [Bacillus sp. Leaf13]KRF65690.1 3-hydroxybutyrate dehydrogenase [Bacillus sp. Soil768D1]MBK5458598.1 3-hydroxybutyrate dehydrogenase [Peribacillus sp. TH27]MBK5480504.1 3-hydroxybutyrate dehydrogenase [Peribacillus sp. TH16]MED3688100.1 3-hydroxybutyrate dehydrogenase [Peribacillus butanolivorans]
MVKDKVAIITGSARGIGFEIGKIFAENGAKVVLSDLNQITVEDAALDLRNKGLEVTGFKADVTNEEDIIQLIKQTKRKYGRIDIFINNAGLQHVAPIEEFPTEKFEQMIKIMLTAPFIAIKNVLPIMKEQGFGRIINISSINGLIGFANKAAYNSAKHGVIGLTKVAALESASSGITVNALCPGYVDTPLVRGQLEDLARTRQVPLESVLEEVIYPLVPQNRLLDVSEIADYAIFLASDKARGITGQAVVLDGGYTAQ